MTEHTSVGERKRMVEPDHSGLSVLQQCILLGLARSSFYYKPVGESEFNLMIMRIMDEIHLDYPYYGVRRIMAELQRRGYGVGEKRVQRLMKLMGIEAMYPKPKTTVAAPEHKKYSYLLRGLDIWTASRKLNTLIEPALLEERYPSPLYDDVLRTGIAV